MALITRTQVIKRPVEQVFSTVIDAGNFAAWNSTIKASRRLDEGEIGNGSRFEWQLRGFGKVVQELQEFEPNRRVRIVPQLKSLSGGHRFLFTAPGDTTRIDHQLEMVPSGLFRLFAPMIARTGSKNLRDTAEALRPTLSVTIPIETCPPEDEPDGSMAATAWSPLPAGSTMHRRWPRPIGDQLRDKAC
jgi:uncharacterized protein YndB with AHSA1/START domain